MAGFSNLKHLEEMGRIWKEYLKKEQSMTAFEMAIKAVQVLRRYKRRYRKYL